MIFTWQGKPIRNTHATTAAAPIKPGGYVSSCRFCHVARCEKEKLPKFFKNTRTKLIRFNKEHPEVAHFILNRIANPDVIEDNQWQEEFGAMQIVNV